MRPVRDLDCLELPVAGETARLGQQILMLGFPDLSGADGSLSATPGYVVNQDLGLATGDFIIAGTSNSGGSGSPILNAQGEVVGMVGGGLAFETDAEGEYTFDYTPVVWAVDVGKHLR